MTSDVQGYQLVRPPTQDELEQLAVIEGVSFLLAVLAFVCVLAAACMVAAKTRVPGRYSVLLSVLVLPLWWAFEQLWGGSLELTFGPVAQLVSVIFYSVFAVVFSFGFVRMCRAFLAVSAADSRDR